MKNILLLKGGPSTEHEVSLRSAKFLKENLETNVFNVYDVLISKNGHWMLDDNEVHLDSKNNLVTKEKEISIDFVIPCIHGYPGETGHLQALFEMQGLKYLGEGYEQSLICFNKILTKLVLDKNCIDTVPFIFVNDSNELSVNKVRDFFKVHGNLFFKASNQGSSVGCFHLEDENKIKETIDKCLQYSTQVIIEKRIKMRELEVSVFNYKNTIHATHPCEIITHSDFYDYEAKYSTESKTETILKSDLPNEVIKKINSQALAAFKALNLGQFCRMDFFYDQDNYKVFLNEVNTFPGLTQISMFPKMMEAYGIDFKEFLKYSLK